MAAPHDSQRPAIALFVLVLLAASGLWFALPVAQAPAPVEAPGPTAPPDAAPAAPLVAAPLPATVSATPRPPATALPFQSGFCPPETGDETITIRWTLQRLAGEELTRRLTAAPAELRLRLEQAAAQLSASGVLPGPALSDQQAETALLLSTLGKARGRPAKLLEAARALSARLPASPYPLLAAALAAEGLGAVEQRTDALRAARKLLPEAPALGWALAQATRESPDLDEAIEGLATYLSAEPSPPVARLRARLSIQRDLQRDDLRRTVQGVTLLWPPDTLSQSQADAVLAAVDGALDEAAQLTGTRRRRQLTVVLYPGRSELLAVSCVQSWAGGLFDGTLRLIAAPEQPLGVDARALRHETLHAQLSPLAPHAPKWFHEGLAQSFAGAAARARPQWALMVRSQSWIPFSSLDGSFQVFEASADANLAYAQSLGLVEYLRETGGDGAIAEAIRAFGDGADTATALARGCRRPEVTGSDLLAFLSRRLEQGAH